MALGLAAGAGDETGLGLACGTGVALGVGVAGWPIFTSGICESSRKSLDSIFLSESVSRVGVRGFETSCATSGTGFCDKARKTLKETHVTMVISVRTKIIIRFGNLFFSIVIYSPKKGTLADMSTTTFFSPFVSEESIMTWSIFDVILKLPKSPTKESTFG